MDFEPYSIESACLDDVFTFQLSSEDELKDSVKKARAIKAKHRLNLAPRFFRKNVIRNAS